MTAEDRKILSRINKYADEVMGDIDPQKVQVSTQIEKLRPILQEIADEKGISLEDMFIYYMDIQTEAACLSNEKLKEELSDVMAPGNGDHPFLFR